MSTKQQEMREVKSEIGRIETNLSIARERCQAFAREGEWASLHQLAQVSLRDAVELISLRLRLVELEANKTARLSEAKRSLAREIRAMVEVYRNDPSLRRESLRGNRLVDAAELVNEIEAE